MTNSQAPGSVPPGSQPPAHPDWLRKFLTEEQDPNQVVTVLNKVKQILTSGEEVVYVAVQKPLMSLSPDSIILTNKRFIVYHPTLLGGASFQDHIWRDLHDARLNEGIINAAITMRTIQNQIISIESLPKAQARRLYSFAQEMEEKVREERRMREMEEKRAAAGGIILQGGLPTAAQAPAQQEDPVQKLKKLKDMLDAGLITAQEYEAKKTDILSRF